MPFSPRALMLISAASILVPGAAWANDGAATLADEAETQPVETVDGTAGEDEAIPGNRDIVVTAQGGRGSVITDVPADTTLDPTAIASYGASNAAELVAALSAQTRSGRGRGDGPPVVLVNGRRVSGFGEIRNIPQEAIARVEIFPEEVALDYGFSADQRVINFVLSDNFFALTGELEGGGSTHGGRWTQEAEASILRLTGPTRINVTVNYERASALTEAERSIVQPARATPLTANGFITAPSGGEISPALSAAAGRTITGVALPDGAITLPALAAAADVAPIGIAEGQFRTLLPRGDQWSFDATVARPIAPQVNASLNLRYERNDTTSQLGLATGTITVPAGNAALPFSAPVLLTRAYGVPRPLIGENASDVVNAGATVDGRLGRWRWTFTGTVDYANSETSNDRGPDLAALQAAVTAGANPFTSVPATLAPDIAEQSSWTSDANIILNGPLAELPAGRVRATLQAGVRRIDLDGLSTRSGVTTLTALGRTALNASVNIDVPIADRDSDVLPFLGELSVNGQYRVRDVSDFSTLHSWTGGITWSPFERFSLLATYIGEENAPGVSQLGAPQQTTPLRAIFDFTRGETVLADIITGGNPLLRAETRRDFKLTANWRPIAGQDLTLTSTYARVRSRNTTADFPLLTPEIEAAFPGRVVRGADGRIISVDQRPVNFTATRGTQLRSGISFSRGFGSPPPGAGGPPGMQRPAGAGAPRAGGPASGAPGTRMPPATGTPGAGGPPPGMGRGAGGPRMGGGGGFGRGMFGGPGGQAGRWSLSVFHTVRFQDEVDIGPGIPTLDLLGGSATGSSGGSPRHEVEFDGGWFYRGLGVRGSGVWRDGSRVVGGPVAGGGTASDLRFSPQFTVNLRAFVDLTQQRALVDSFPFFRNARIRIAVDNLFNDVREVRDANGVVPLRYQPGFVDPAGRTFELSFRKQF